METPVPVMFIHGTRTSSAIWAEQEKVLRDLGHHTIAIDLPGHGKNIGQPFDMAQTFDLIRSHVLSLGRPVILVGLSLGGYISLGYAAQNPDHVVSVLAAGCSTETSRSIVRAYRAITAAMSSAFKKFKTPRLHNSVPRHPDWSVVTDMLGEVGRMSSLANLRALRCPVLLVSGQWCPLRFGERRTRRAQPDAQYIIIPKSGHDVNLHAPEIFNKILRSVVTNG